MRKSLLALGRGFVQGPPELPPLAANRGFTDGLLCAGVGTYPVYFSRPVSFTSHAGVSFYNATTAETATGVLTVAESSPSSILTYSGVTWVTPPAVGDVIEFHYDGLGTYKDVTAAGKIVQAFNTGDRALNGYIEDVNIPWVEASGEIQIVSNAIQQTGSTFRRPTLAFDETGYRFEFTATLSVNTSSGAGPLIRAANTSNEVRIAVTRPSSGTARLTLTPRSGGTTHTGNSTGELALDISVPRKIIIIDNGDEILGYFEDLPDNIAVINTNLPSPNTKLGWVFQSTQSHRFDDFVIHKPTYNMPAQQVAITNCADWTVDGLYRHGSIYSATKDVAATWLYEKQATAVNTLWVKNATIDISIGYGGSNGDPNDSWVEQVVVTAGSSVLIPVTGDYIAWKAADDLSTGTADIEQSVSRL